MGCDRLTIENSLGVDGIARGEIEAKDRGAIASGGWILHAC
jgi:hypothetical protein